MASWLIDTDAGVDDIQALVIALRHPSTFNVVGITVVAGNVPLPKASVNVAECLRMCGREDIPYFNGAERPIVSPLVSGESIHGADGLNGYWNKKHGESLPTLKQPEALHAASAIIKLATEHSPLNIVTLGPLTNLALALMIDSTLHERLGRVVVMGGAVHAKGNITPVAEYNVYADPEAAHICLERLPMVELLSWECSIDPLHQFDNCFFEAYTGGYGTHGEMIRLITLLHEGKSTVFFCDPLTVCIAMDPTTIKQSVEKHCTVELAGGRTRGMLVVNWGFSDMPEINSAKSNVKIIQRLDIDRIKQIFLGSVAS